MKLSPKEIALIFKQTLSSTFSSKWTEINLDNLYVDLQGKQSPPLKNYQSAHQ